MKHFQTFSQSFNTIISFYGSKGSIVPHLSMYIMNNTFLTPSDTEAYILDCPLFPDLMESSDAPLRSFLSHEKLSLQLVPTPKNFF